jgi:hypothetical protein
MASVLVTPWLFNLGHAPLFGMFAALLGLASRRARCRAGGAGWWAVPDRRRAAFVTAALVAVGYGVLLEWVQSGIPGRSADSLDIVMDAIGALGVPWGLSSGWLFGRRTWIVFVMAGALSAWTTWGRR